LKPMDMEKLVKSFGHLTEEEITAGCRILDPKIDSYETARVWLWIVIRRLVDTEKFNSAKTLIEGLGWSAEFKTVIAERRNANPNHVLDAHDRMELEWL
jgi:hypothetical protein